MVQLSLLFTKRSSTSLIIPCVYNDNAKLRKKVLHKCKYIGIILRYTRHGEGKRIVKRELFAADVESIESVCAVGAVFEERHEALLPWESIFRARQDCVELIVSSALVAGLVKATFGCFAMIVKIR